MFKFYLDEAGEREILQQMFSGWSGCSVKERALQYGIPLDIARQCEKTDVPCPALADYLAKGYVLYRKELKQALTFHKRYWREHRLETKEKLKNIFGHKIPPYTVRLNLQCDGISNWYGTDISINAFQYLRPEKHRQSEHYCGSSSCLKHLWTSGRDIQQMNLTTIRFGEWLSLRQ